MVILPIMQPYEAIRIFNRELQFDPYSADILLALAVSHLNADEVSKAQLAVDRLNAIIRRPLAPPGRPIKAPGDTK